MVLRGLTNEDGYTMVEMLVAITIVSIVIAMVGSVFIFVSRQMKKWDENTRFYNEYHLVQNQVFWDVLRAEEIVVTDSNLVLGNGEDSYDEYSLDNSPLKRNGLELTQEVESMTLGIEDDFRTSDLKKWSLTQKGIRREIAAEFYVNSRKPALWKSLNDRGN